MSWPPSDAAGPLRASSRVREGPGRVLLASVKSKITKHEEQDHAGSQVHNDRPHTRGCHPGIGRCRGRRRSSHCPCPVPNLELRRDLGKQGCVRGGDRCSGAGPTPPSTAASPTGTRPRARKPAGRSTTCGTDHDRPHRPRRRQPAPGTNGGGPRGRPRRYQGRTSSAPGDDDSGALRGRGVQIGHLDTVEANPPSLQVHREPVAQHGRPSSHDRDVLRRGLITGAHNT